MQEYIENQLHELATELNELQKMSFKINEIAAVCIEALKNGHKILFCGNGGSASQNQSAGNECPFINNGYVKLNGHRQ